VCALWGAPQKRSESMRMSVLNYFPLSPVMGFNLYTDMFMMAGR
jgi:hypothetical protein